MYRIHSDSGEILVPHRFEDGMYGAADPAHGNKRHHMTNRVPVPDLKTLREYHLRGWPIWMSIRGTRDRRLISRGIIDAEPPAGNGPEGPLDRPDVRPAEIIQPTAPLPAASASDPGISSETRNVDTAAYLELLKEMSEQEIKAECDNPARLLLASSNIKSGRRFDIAYAPFEHVNRHAKIVIVGITPGKQQMQAALLSARNALRSGLSHEDALAVAKVHASFAGPMRTNLVNMLDALGVHELLGIRSTSTLWSQDSHLAHFTSAIRYPTFNNGENYTGRTPELDKVPFLLSAAETWLAPELSVFQDAVIVPMGGIVERVVKGIDGFGSDRVLSGFPHASGANPDVHRFLGKAGEDNEVRRRFHVTVEQVAALAGKKNVPGL